MEADDFDIIDILQEIIDEETGEILCDTDNEDCVTNPMKGVAESMIMTFLMSVGELAPCWDALQYSNHEYIGKIHWGLFVMIVFLLLLNLLIAMMGDTYAKVDNIYCFFISFLVQIAAIKNEWMRQWAKTLLITERGIAPKWVDHQIFRLENLVFSGVHLCNLSQNFN